MVEISVLTKKRRAINSCGSPPTHTQTRSAHLNPHASLRLPRRLGWRIVLHRLVVPLSPHALGREKSLVPDDGVDVTVQVSAAHLGRLRSVPDAREDDHVAEVAQLGNVRCVQHSKVSCEGFHRSHVKFPDPPDHRLA